MVIILLICEFSYEILYESSIIYFLRAKRTWESFETQPLLAAGEALPWKLNRFGPECTHVHLFYCVDCLF